jgi:cytochrome c oxidase cbb3-type subunit III
MSERTTKGKPGEVETTGHIWDGIQEYNNPLPRWWLWTFYACIAWALVYSFLFPAWPLVTGATPGLLGWSTRANVQAEINSFDARNKAMMDKLMSVNLTEIKDDPNLLQFANSVGAAVFRANCSQCHGAGAAGVKSLGYPNLLDDDWLWGGDIESVLTTVTHGIRNTTDDEARFSQMPSFGKDELLDKAQIDAVVQHVMAISGQEHDAALAAEGATVFSENCVACHNEDGKGNREFGAPNLTDAVWLYGGDKETLTNTVTNARFGVMPNWSPRLSDAQIRAVAIYVHGLGGGE